MKKLLLSLSALFIACLSAKAQSTASYSIAATPDITAMTFVPGEEFSFDVDYEVELENSEALFFQVIFGEANVAGTALTFNNPGGNNPTFDAAGGWGAIGANVNDTQFLTETRTLTSTVPAGIKTSDTYPNGVAVCVRVKAAGDVTIGTETCSVITVEANSVTGDLTDVAWSPSSVAAGGDLTLDFNYTSNVPVGDLTNKVSAQIYITDATGKFDPANVETFADLGTGLAEATASTAGTYTWSLPASLTPSAGLDVAAGEYYKINLTAFGKEYRDSINVSAALNSISMVDGTLSTPASAELGESITIEFDYASDYPDEQPVIVSLVVADKTTGDFIIFPAGTEGVPAIGGWKTAGFTDPATTLVAAETEASFSYIVNAAEAVATTDLAANEEWRLYIKLGSDQELKNSDAPVIEITPALVDKIVITGLSYEAAAEGDSILVDFEYSAINAAEVELVIVEYINEFTAATPLNEVSVSRFVVGLDATTLAQGLVAGPSDRVTIALGTTISAALTGGNQYRIVAKLLSAADNSFITQTTAAINIVDAANVIGLGNKATVASFTIFPNPSNGIVNFSKEVSNVVVYDATGNVVITEATATSLTTSSLEAGIYMVNTDQGSTKFIVE